MGVCLKALFYSRKDHSIRFIEWIERLKTIGVDHVLLYNAGINKNLERVLTYYENEGFVSSLYFHFPSGLVDIPFMIKLWAHYQPNHYWKIENVYHTDCVFRLKDRYDYILTLDLDEFPVLLQHRNLQEFIANYKP